MYKTFLNIISQIGSLTTNQFVRCLKKQILPNRITIQNLFLTALLIFFSNLSFEELYSKNTVLKLDGRGSFIELPSNILDSLDNSTIEGWFKWNSFNYFSQPFGYGSEWNIFALNNELTSNTLQYFIYKNKELSSIKIDKILNLDEWYHIAAVSGQDGMKLYINGLLVGKSDDNKKSFSSIKNKENKFYLGKSHWDINAFFDGEMDEIRVWKTIRTEEEIRANLFKSLKGDEEDLFALWNFEGSNSNDFTKNNFHGKEYNKVQYISSELPRDKSQLNETTYLEGYITGKNGEKVIEAEVILSHLNETENILSITKTDEDGFYRLNFTNKFIKDNKESSFSYDINIVKNNIDRRIRRISLKKGSLNSKNFVLTEGNSISGRISDFENSPINLITVQLLTYDNEKLIIYKSVQSDNNGNYTFFNIEEGEYLIKVLLENEPIYYNNKQLITLKDDTNLIYHDLTVSPQRKGEWRNYKHYDGLDNADITKIKKGSKGELYFATRSGVYTYDGDSFNFFPDENSVISKKNIAVMEIDSRGNYWFGTIMEGVYKYDRNGIFVKNYTMADGLNFNEILSIKEVTDNEIWIGTFKGLNRIDKHGNIILKSEDQKQLKKIYDIRSITTSGNKSEVWFSSLNGITHYSENKFEFLDIKELYGLQIRAIEYDETNNLLYCGSSGNGLIMIDIETKEVTRFYKKNGLTNNWITDLFYSEKTEALWISSTNGISRFKNNFFTNFNSNNGLVFNFTNSIFYDDDENYLLAGTEHGLSAYYEEGFEVFTKKDGLPNNTISSFVIDKKDRLWLGHTGSVSLLNNLENKNNKFITIPNISAGYLTALYNDKAVLFTDFSYGIIAASIDSLKVLFKIDESNGIIGNMARAIRNVGNEIWIGTPDNGIFCYENDSIVDNKINLKRNILEQEQIYCLSSDLEFDKAKEKYNKEWTAWVGTYDNGIFIIKSNDEITNLTTDDGLIHNSISTLYNNKNSNTLWIGTPHGVSCLNTETKKFFLPDGIDKLSRNLITSIYEQPNGITWFGTRNSGLFGFDGTAWAHFDERDNLGNRITGIKEDKKQQLWISTDNGLARLRIKELTPKINLISKITGSSSQDLSETQSVIVGKRISIKVGMLNLITDKGDQQFRWRIVEESKKFNNPQKKSLIEWTPKRTGTFTLEIQGIDKFLNYSNIVSLKFKVEKYWYLRDKIFIPTVLGVILLFLLAVYFIVKFFIQKRLTVTLQENLLEQEKEKNKKLSDSLEELKLAKEEAIKEKEKAELANSVKTNFLANMSHEIRTPLNAVIGFVELLSDKFLDKKEVSYVEAIKLGGKNLLNLINDILDISKIETSKLDIKYRFVDPRIILNEIKDIFAVKASQKKLKLEVVVDPYLPHLLNIDETRIRQILVNTVGNSLKFTYEGFVRVSISVYGKKSKENTIDLQISIKDSGIGINENIVDKIFDPFIQGNTDYAKNVGGTGLGLSISKKLVEIMKGEISVTSKVGKGTTLKVILRDVKYTFKQKDERTDKKKEFKLGEIRFYGGNILIVDNNNTNRYLLKELLSRVNLDVIFARDYDEAISRISNFNIDLIMLDLKDPVINSEEIAKNLKERTESKRIDLFALVSTLSDEELKKYKELGFSSFIYRPVDIYSFIEKLTHIFEYSLLTKRSKELNEGDKKADDLHKDNTNDYIYIAKKSIFQNESLKKIISNNLLPAIKELRRSGRMTMIREFGVELKNVGAEYKIPYFKNFGTKLIEKADTFDVGGVSIIFDELEDLLKNIEKQIN